MHNYTKYTLLAFIKEAVIDNSHAIMNVRTNMHLLPHVYRMYNHDCNHNIPFYHIYNYIITRQNVNYPCISCF